ncbi:MAG: HAD family hydrolase [Acidimicrobiia bacterium]
MIQAVIFDYGGVFSTPLFRGIGDFEARMGYPPGSVLELLFGDKAYVGVEGAAHRVERELPAESVTHDWHRLEVGELTLKEWFEGVQARAPEVLGTDIDMGAYLQFMADMPIGVHWPIVHRARELKAGGTRIALLTNNVAEWGDNWRSTIPVEELFEVVVDSSAVRLRKPDPEIYELTCERVGIAPAAAVFLDDNADNIAAARSLGMETVHVGEDPFAAVAELDAILTRRGTPESATPHPTAGGVRSRPSSSRRRGA